MFSRPASAGRHRSTSTAGQQFTAGRDRVGVGVVQTSHPARTVAGTAPVIIAGAITSHSSTISDHIAYGRSTRRSLLRMRHGAPNRLNRRGPGASSRGIDRSSARVYGCRGEVNNCRRRTSSTTWPEIHHRHPVGDLGDHAEVVGDEHHRHAEVVLHGAQQVEDLALRGHVQRGGRLVGDQQLRVAGDRHRDHRPLPHTARQLERVGVEPRSGLRMPTPAQLVDRPFPRVGRIQLLVQHDHLGQLPADRVHRAERGHRFLEDHARSPCRGRPRMTGPPVGSAARSTIPGPPPCLPPRRRSCGGASFLGAALVPLQARRIPLPAAGQCRTVGRVRKRSRHRSPGRARRPAQDRTGRHALAAPGFADHAEGLARTDPQVHSVDRPHHAVRGTELRASVRAPGAVAPVRPVPCSAITFSSRVIGIGRVAQTVADEVERHHGDDHGQPGESIHGADDSTRMLCASPRGTPQLTTGVADRGRGRRGRSRRGSSPVRRATARR